MNICLRIGCSAFSSSQLKSFTAFNPARSLIVFDSNASKLMLILVSNQVTSLVELVVITGKSMVVLDSITGKSMVVRVSKHGTHWLHWFSFQISLFLMV